MHWIKVTNPQYEQSARYRGQVGEVVGHWGPENSEQGRDGFLVEFSDGEIVGVTEHEVEGVDEPEARKRPPAPRRGGG
ncbi:MAG TPA: hypothetical protein VK939_18400 [Longimicrobiales bacterium]|nr:hypothetical protein [Longimicrobiales bacterium]